MSQSLIAVDPERLDRLEAELRALREQLQGATIVPRPEWLTVAQAADALNVSGETIRRRIASGELEAKGSGKTRRVRF